MVFGGACSSIGNPVAQEESTCLGDTEIGLVGTLLDLDVPTQHLLRIGYFGQGLVSAGKSLTVPDGVDGPTYVSFRVRLGKLLLQNLERGGKPITNAQVPIRHGPLSVDGQKEYDTSYTHFVAISVPGFEGVVGYESLDSVISDLRYLNEFILEKVNAHYEESGFPSNLESSIGQHTIDMCATFSERASNLTESNAEEA